MLYEKGVDCVSEGSIQNHSSGKAVAEISEKKSQIVVPRLIAESGDRVIRSYLDFFFAQIDNDNTRTSYIRAIVDFFTWLDDNRENYDLLDIETLDVVAWVKWMEVTVNPVTGKLPSKATVRQRLSAVKSLFNWFRLHQFISISPASAVKKKRERLSRGKTQSLLPKEARKLLDAIETTRVIDETTVPCQMGIRDKALISLMLFTFARISGALSMNVDDVEEVDGRLFVSLHEKGGKETRMPCSLALESALRPYLALLRGFGTAGNMPLFQTVNRQRQLTGKRLHRTEAWYMVRRRAGKAEIPVEVCNHTFRATGITTYLEHPDARLELAQAMAGHADPATTLLYDHREDKVTQKEVERVDI